jgi:hypothetical protein
MTDDRIAAKLDELGAKLNTEFGRIDTRLSSLEKHSVTRSDVHAAVFQGLAFAAAAIVGTVVVLNAIGAFP